MPIKMELRENGRILYVKYSDPWSITEMQPMFKQDQAYRDNSQAIIHTLIDVSELRKIPPPMIATARRTPSLNHPRRGVMVVVGAMAFIQALAEALGRITRSSQLKFFKSEELGMAYLHRLVEEEDAKNAPPKAAEAPVAAPPANVTVEDAKNAPPKAAEAPVAVPPANVGAGDSPANVNAPPKAAEAPVAAPPANASTSAPPANVGAGDSPANVSANVNAEQKPG